MSDKKLCLLHPTEDKMIDREAFDYNPLTHDLKHLVCRRCTTAKETAFRIERATAMLKRRGLNPCIPITMTIGEL